MAKIKFKILNDYGALSEYGDVYFRYIDWNGYEKYDLRRWSEDGEEPFKGITFSKEELEDLYPLLKEGTEAVTSFKPKMPLETIKLGKATAKILIEFGSFGESGDMSKQLNYIDWGHGAKFDIRPWTDDYSVCGKGVTLTEAECLNLKEIIETEFGYEEHFGISFEDFVVRSNVFKCNKNHEFETIQAMISVLNYADDKANNLKTFANSYHKLMANQNGNFTVSAYDIFEANNTMYIVMDANEGETFDKCNLSIKEILNSVKLLTHVIGEYHKNGYLHLDVKPENFLVYPRPSEHIVLFDLNSVTAVEDIQSGKIQCVPYSKNWAAPEQIQGQLGKLCPATDIFSIGAVLFQKIMGRSVENSDMGIFAMRVFLIPKIILLIDNTAV